MTAVPDHPREVAVGNIMQLKTPYSAGSRPRKTWTHGIVAQVLHSGMGGGIRNPHWRLSLHLYNPETGEVYLHEGSGIPVYVDFGADEMILLKIARHTGYRTLDHDLYPTCRRCEGNGWVVAGETAARDEVDRRCPDCNGFGKVWTPLPSAPHPETVS